MNNWEEIRELIIITAEGLGNPVKQKHRWQNEKCDCDKALD